MFRTRGVAILVASCAAAASVPRVSAPVREWKGKPVAQARVEKAYGQLPLVFEPNHGQVDERVRWLARCRGYTLFLTEREAVMALREGEGKPSSVVRMRLAGSRRWRRSEGLEATGGISNYFIGNDPKKWRTGIPHYRQVKFAGVYAGIDLVFYGSSENLEYDLVVHAGADPKLIRVAYTGVERLEVDTAGDLVLTTPAGSKLKQRRPRVYQEIGGLQVELAAAYEVREGAQVGIHVEPYDSGKPLVIDPVLVYATYLGGTDRDEVNAIAVGPEGDVYVAGTTWSVDFPTTPGSPSSGSQRGQAFVTRLNSSGTALIYSTFLGGDSSSAKHIFVDSDGYAYIVGGASPNFPVTPGAYQSSAGVFGAGFVAKLNPTGTALSYATYFRSDGIQGLAVDSGGNAYLAGTASPPDLVTTPGAFQTTFGGGDWDAFVAKLNSTGTGVVFATYLGGSGNDVGTDIAVDPDGNSYVTGQTESAAFPTTSGAFQRTRRGSHDVFVTKLNPSGSAAVYSTYLGGSGLDANETGTNPSEPIIGLDATGSAYVAGSTRSTDFPTTPNAYQRSYGGWGDAFVTKLDSSGDALVYSTYLGSDATDDVRAIAVDSEGHAYVTGGPGGEFPTTPGAFQNCPQTYPQRSGSLSDYCDAYLVKLNPAGSSLVYSTGLGGHGWDFPAHRLALDSAGNVWLTGYTSYGNLPVTAGAYQTAHRGGMRDGFITKIDPATVVSSVSAASFQTGGALAPESIVSGFGQALAGATTAATTLPLPTTLSDVSVVVKDSAGWERAAPLFFVSGGQINYQVPAGTRTGSATVVVTNQDNVMTTGVFQVEAVAPGLFTANASGQGVAAAVALRVAADNSQSHDNVFQCGATAGSCVAKPIDLGSDTDRAFLLLYGTGIRGRSSLSAVGVKIGGVDAPVEYAGPVAGFVGLDQVNVQLPRSLLGRGEVQVVLTVDGKTANTVTVNIK